jgi:hypothetical protein
MNCHYRASPRARPATVRAPAAMPPTRIFLSAPLAVLEDAGGVPLADEEPEPPTDAGEPPGPAAGAPVEPAAAPVDEPEPGVVPLAVVLSAIAVCWNWANVLLAVGLIAKTIPASQ